MKTLICPFCEEEFVMGVSGIYTDPMDTDDTMIGCDSCLGIERDDDGRAWLPTEEIKVFVGGQYISRHDALRGNS